RGELGTPAAALAIRAIGVQRREGLVVVVEVDANVVVLVVQRNRFRLIVDEEIVDGSGEGEILLRAFAQRRPDVLADLDVLVEVRTGTGRPESALLVAQRDEVLLAAGHDRRHRLDGRPSRMEPDGAAAGVLRTTVSDLGGDELLEGGEGEVHAASAECTSVTYCAG